MHEHSAPGPSSLQVLSGLLTVNVGSEEHSLAASESLVLEAELSQSVTARAESALLLTHVAP